MGRQISLDHASMAPGMGRSHPVLCLQRGDPEDHLHDQRCGVAEPGAAQDAENTGAFPTEEAVTKLIHLSIRNFEKDDRAVRESVVARTQLAIMFAGRFDA